MGNWVGKLKSVNGILFGCRNEGNELWAMLLEKAYAKAYGSFMTIEGKGGSPRDALRDLTGAPSYIKRHEKLTDDELWDFVHTAEQKNWIICTGTNATAIREEKNELGIQAGHAYSILDSVEVTTDSGRKERIIQIRNPWGKTEWNGDWGDKSSLWTKSTKKQVGGLLD
jgi:calpain-15